MPYNYQSDYYGKDCVYPWSYSSKQRSELKELPWLFDDTMVGQEESAKKPEKEMKIQHKQIIRTNENSFVEHSTNNGKFKLKGYLKTVELPVSEFMKTYPKQAKEILNE